MPAFAWQPSNRYQSRGIDDLLSANGGRFRALMAMTGIRSRSCCSCVFFPGDGEWVEAVRASGRVRDYADCGKGQVGSSLQFDILLWPLDGAMFLWRELAQAGPRCSTVDAVVQRCIFCIRAATFKASYQTQAVGSADPSRVHAACKVRVSRGPVLDGIPGAPIGASSISYFAPQ